MISVTVETEVSGKPATHIQSDSELNLCYKLCSFTVEQVE